MSSTIRLLHLRGIADNATIQPVTNAPLAAARMINHSPQATVHLHSCPPHTIERMTPE
jgi:hypothetical protein